MTGIAAQPARRQHNNRWVAVAALLFALLTAVLIVRYLSAQTQARQTSTTASVPVVTAKHDIASGATISADMVQQKLVTPDVAASTALSQIKLAVGQRARYDIPAGAQLVPSMLVQPSAADALSLIVPPGKRAVAVATTDVINGGNHIRPGDYVDVMAIFDASKLVGGASSSADQNLQGVYTILQNVQVLAVADEAADSASGGPQAKSSDASSAPDLSKNGSVTLAVDPYQAQLLFLSESEGKIRLALRSFGDQNQQPLAPVLEPLGAPASNGKPQ
jgi:pilus assembly protein CpaB